MGQRSGSNLSLKQHSRTKRIIGTLGRRRIDHIVPVPNPHPLTMEIYYSQRLACELAYWVFVFFVFIVGGK